MLCKQFGREVVTQICRKGRENGVQCGPVGTVNSKMPLFRATVLPLEIEMQGKFALFRAIFLLAQTELHLSSLITIDSLPKMVVVFFSIKQVSIHKRT